ncbi:hypothetical protein SOVF_165480, partial [Spinacia oleracea]
YYGLLGNYEIFFLLESILSRLSVCRMIAALLARLANGHMTTYSST